MNRIIIFVILAILLYIGGKRLYSGLVEKIESKRDVENIERKLDSIFLEYQKLYDILASEKDTVEVRIKESVTNIYKIREEPESSDMTSDEILERLKFLSIEH